MINNEFLIDANVKSSASKSKDEMLSSVDTEQLITNNPNVLKFESSNYQEDKQKNNLYRYIFGNPNESIGNKVYQVGYFKVETDVSGQNSPNMTSSVHSEKPNEKKKIKFKRCDSECSKKETGSCPDSICTLDLPEEVANLTQEIKCQELNCNYKKHRELPPAPDDRILLDLSGFNTDCCNQVKEKVEEVVGVMAKMKIGPDSCFCSCECGLFSMLTRKTTYCSVCGGYEVAANDITNKGTRETPMPCPIFHKLVDKSKLKTWSTSGSESKKKGDDQKSIKGNSGQKVATDKRSIISEKKSVESEKGRKQKKDERFKFNYGYKGIPPQIGHSKCAFPCTGTLDNVPKRMGWLWSAENIPGMKVSRGWKPGAISKKILRMLNKAKSHKSTAETVKRAKPAKKQIEDKPTLKICKQNGQYHIELQATSENPVEGPDRCTPLVYKIESINNKAKLKMREKIQRRLLKAAVNEVWSDPYHPEACERVCLPAYQRAVGVLPESEYDRMVYAEQIDSESFSCNDEISSSCTSSEVEWEIHYTPPFAPKQLNHRDSNNEIDPSHLSDL